MSKAVLVLPETPENCADCPIGNDISIGWKKCIQCNPAHNCVKGTEIENKRPDWFPLRPFPEREQADQRDGAYYVGWVQGWNDCLRAIEGSGE